MLAYQVESFGRPLARVIRDTPVPTGSEVLLRIGSCGVCHSDVHLQDGYFDLGGGNKLDLTRSMTPPRTMGHEIAGTVVALGPDAQADALGVQLGDPRVVYPWIGCGDCATCRRGEEQLCLMPRNLGIGRDGGFADHVLVPHPRYLMAYAGLSEEQACTYACSGLTAYGALKKLVHVKPLESLLIIGAGGVGLSGVRLAKSVLGVAPIVAETDPAKWDLAREAGAADVIDPSADGAGKLLAKISGGGVAGAIDFVGATASFNFGLAGLRKGGTLVCVGLFGGASVVVPALITMRSVTISGSYVGSPQDLRELLALAGSGALPALPLSTRPLADASAALDELRAGKIRGRTILKP